MRFPTAPAARFRSHRILQPIARLALAFATGTLGLLATGCGIEQHVATAAPGAAIHVTGSIHGGQQVVTGSTLQLYAVGTTGDGSASTPLLTVPVTTSDGTGNAGNANANAGNHFNALPPGAFDITGDFTCPSASTQVYLSGRGGNPGLSAGTNNAALTLLAFLGPCGGLTPSTTLSINELTTVGSLAPLAPYIVDYAHIGSGASDASAFLSALNLVPAYTNATDGSVPGPSLPAGYDASSAAVTTLADVTASCINSDGIGGVCQQLFTLATPPAGSAPTEIVAAVADILNNPTNNTAAIFALAAPGSPFQPTLANPPASWSLPIVPLPATPVITPAGGSYSSAPDITIQDATPGAAIYYTIDGASPTTASTLYTAPFQLPPSNSTTRVVRAIAVANGAASAVAVNTYTIPNAGIVKAVKFLTQPTDTIVGQAIPDFQVGFADAYGTQVLVNNTGITIGLGTNPAGATLGGTTVFGTSNRGYAIAGALTLNKVANGYTLTATSGSYTPATSAVFNIKPLPITFTLPSPLIGNGRTLTGTFTLPAAAPTGGTVVTLTSSDATIISVTPATVTVAAGATTGSFTYTAAGTGSATITASATGASDGTTTVTTTTNVITLGTFPTAPNNTATPVTLTLSPASTAFTSVTLTSSNTTVGTITNIVNVGSGATTPASPPQFTGKSFGTTTVLATAPGYAPDAQLVTLSGTATLTQNLTTTRGTTLFPSITLSSAVSVNTVFTLTSDTPGVATVPATATVFAGNTVGTFAVTTVGIGSTVIHATATGLAPLTSTVTVTGTVSALTSVPVIGMIAPAYFTLASAAASPITVTVTSNSSAVLLSDTANGPFSTSVTLTNVTGNTVNFFTSTPASGSANLTISSPSLTSFTGFVSTRAPYISAQIPSTFATSTTVQNGPESFFMSLGYSNSGSFVPCQSIITNAVVCQLPAATMVTTSLGSSTPAVGTFDKTSLTFTSSVNNLPVVFTPLSNGSTGTTLGTLPANYVSGGTVIYVYQPGFTAGSSTIFSGTGVTTTSTGTNLAFTDTRPGGATVTVTAANSALVRLSLDPNVVGSSTLTIPGITKTIPTIYIQGQAVGTTDLVFSSPGYQGTTITINVFQTTVNLTGTVAVSTASTDATLTLTLFVNNGNCFSCFLNPDLASTAFGINSSNTAVGAAIAPVTFAAGTNVGTTTFRATAAGTTNLTAATPPTPLILASSANPIVANVSQSTIVTAAVTTGALLQVTTSFNLNPATTGRTVTVTSSNPSVALVSASSTVAGSSSATFTSIASNTFYYVQGISPGTTTFQISSPGYATQSQTITVLPSGFYFSGTTGNFSINAFASPYTITVYLAGFNATTGAVALTCSSPSVCTLNPGAGFTSTLVSSNTTAGTITGGPLTFTPGTANVATTTFTPNDIGVSTLSFSGAPAAFTAPSTGTANVTGYLFNAGNVSIGAGTYGSFDTNLNTIPPVPLSITLTVLDPTLARLSTDKAVLGTGGTITYNNVTCQTSFCSTGGAPFTYIQGIAPGFTKIRLTARGYYPATMTIVVNKLGLTLFSLSSAYITGIIGSSTPGTVAGLLGLLDPYSNSLVSDCSGATSCPLNPGVSPTFSLVPDDPSIGTFGPAGAFDTSSNFARSTYTALSPGQTNFQIGTAPTGFYNVSTASRKAGLASSTVSGSAGVQNSLYLIAPNVDAGVGVEVASTYGLSGTVLGADTTPVTITSSDPTVAVVSTATTTAGSAAITIAGCYCGSTFYVQGLKAGVVTLTYVKAGYLSRSVTVTVRPSGFVIKSFDFVGPSVNSTLNVTVNPAILNDAGQWMANAQLNPGSGTVVVPVTSSNTGIATATSATFATNSTSATFSVRGIALGGSSTLTLGTPPAPYTQPTTYQSVVVTEN